MNAHSAKTCQCSSRTPPAVSRMLTPAMVSEIWKSACVTWRAQPPFWIRFGALLKDAQNCGRSPTSVDGGEDAAGNLSASAALCGPGSVTLAGFAALTAPCGGSSGLPNGAARAPAERTEAAASPPAAPSRLRRVVSSMIDSTEIRARAALASSQPSSDRQHRARTLQRTLQFMKSGLFSSSNRQTRYGPAGDFSGTPDRPRAVHPAGNTQPCRRALAALRPDFQAA